jgi:hypothetical protein
MEMKIMKTKNLGRKWLIIGIVALCVILVSIPSVSSESLDVNSDMKTLYQEDLEVHVITDKTNYTRGELVNITIWVINNGNEDVNLVFPTMQLCDYKVVTEDETVVYIWSHEKFFPQVVTSVIIPNHTAVALLNDTWNQCDNNGNQVPGGRYYVDGFIVENFVTDEIHGESVSITIHEPKLDITLQGRYLFRRLSIVLNNFGDGIAYNVNWTFDLSIPYFFWGLNTTYFEGGKETLEPGEEFIGELNFTRLFGIGPFRITVTADASNAESVSKTYKGFIAGFIILFISPA